MTGIRSKSVRFIFSMVVLDMLLSNSSLEISVLPKKRYVALVVLHALAAAHMNFWGEITKAFIILKKCVFRR